MKKIILGLLCLFMVSASLFADMTKSELQQMYLTFFRNNGITASVDEDGDVMFEFKGEHINNALTYYIVIDENDPQFFPIVYFLTEADNTEVMQVALAACAASRDAFIAKIYVNRNNYVIASVETFLVSPQDFEAVFFNLMIAMEDVLLYFVNYLE